jgi:hypothetical protein
MSDSFHYDKLTVLNQVYHHTLTPYDGILHGIDDIITPLYSHQTTMVQRMHEYQDKMLNGFMIDNQAIHGKIGIIGDDIGSGKTLSILAYLASIKASSSPSPSAPPSSPVLSSSPVSTPVSTPVPNPLSPVLSSSPVSTPVSNPLSPVLSSHRGLTYELTPFSVRYFYSHNLDNTLNTPRANLIIVPHSIFHEWRNQIQTHTTLRYVAIETRRMLRGDMLINDMTDSTFVLTTNKCYKYVNDYAQQHGIKWNHVFIDDAASIYINSSDPPLQFQFLWLITNQWIPLLFKNATFNRAPLYLLRNTIQCLHPELDKWLSETHSMPYEEGLNSSGFLKDYLTFHHPSRHLIVLRNATERMEEVKLPQPEIMSIHCRPNISLASLMSYYVSRQMEPNIQSHQVPYLFQTIGIPFFSLSHYLSFHPSHKHQLIKRKTDDNECVVCLERCEYPTMVSCCYHMYCGKCLLKSILMNGKCPTCRNQVTPVQMNCFGNISVSERIELKNKLEMCLDWIRKNPSGRFLIYSAFDNIYYQLFEEIDRMGRKSERLENHHFSLIKTIRNFKHGTTQILFVSNPELLRGLSFPFVTHLLFYHDQPSYEKKQLLFQSAHRLGRTQPLHVIHLHSEIQV